MNVEDIFAIAVNGSLFVIFLIFLILFVYRSYKSNVNIKYLALTVVFAISGQILTIFDNYLISICGVFLYNLGFFFFFLHFDALSSLTPSYPLFTTLIVFHSVTLGVVLLSLLGLLKNLTTAFLVTRLITSTSSLIALIAVTVIVYQVHQVAKERATGWALVGVIFLVLCRMIFLGRDITDLFVGLLADYPDIYSIITTTAVVIATIGLIIILMNHIISPDYLYKLPFPIRAVMLYNSKGLTVYSKQTVSDYFPYPMEELLVTGALTAISNLISETLGAGASLRHINAEKYHIFFVDLPNRQGTLVVIAMGSTYYFKQSLERFAKKIPHELLFKVNETKVDVKGIREEINKLLINTFPYLSFEE